MSSAGEVFGSQVLAGLRAADQALDCAATGAVWQCSDDAVETALELVDRLDARSAALRSTLLTEADRRGLQHRTGAPSTERWLADRYRWTRSEAARRLALARAHTRQPAVHAALAAGTVTTEQAGVIAARLDRIDAVPGVSVADRAQAAAMLVEQAQTLDARGLEVTGRALVETLTRLPSVDDPADAAALERDRERAEREAQQRETNRFRLVRRGGRARGVIDLGPLGAATARAWVHLAGRAVPGVDGFEDTRDKAERLGDAVVEMMATAAAGTEGSCGGGAADAPHATTADGCERCRGTDRDDPADDPAEPGLFGDGREDRPVSPISPIALLNVTVTLEDLRAGLTGAGRLDTGQTLSAATLRQLACDSMVIPAVLNGRSEVLDLGRTRRLYSLPQRRATILHQRACAAPGCDRPPQACQVHHDWEWDKGGPTDLKYATVLCGYHHRMVHRQGWTVRRAANSYPEFVPPVAVDPLQRPRQHVRYQLLDGTRLRT